MMRIITDQAHGSALFIQSISPEGTVKIIAEIRDEDGKPKQLELMFGSEEIREIVVTMAAAALVAVGAATETANTENTK